MVGLQTLDLPVRVQILLPQPHMASSTSGLGRRPLKAETGVRIPLGLPYISHSPP